MSGRRSCSAASPSPLLFGLVVMIVVSLLGIV